MHFSTVNNRNQGLLMAYDYLYSNKSQFDTSFIPIASCAHSRILETEVSRLTSDYEYVQVGRQWGGSGSFERDARVFIATKSAIE